MAYMGGTSSWTYWSLNPNSGDTGGILKDDWVSVQQWKLDLLTPYQARQFPAGALKVRWRRFPGRHDRAGRLLDLLDSDAPEEREAPARVHDAPPPQLGDPPQLSDRAVVGPCTGVPRRPARRRAARRSFGGCGRAAAGTAAPGASDSAGSRAAMRQEIADEAGDERRGESEAGCAARSARSASHVSLRANTPSRIASRAFSDGSMKRTPTSSRRATRSWKTSSARTRTPAPFRPSTRSKE